jgi:hypothetical protein
MTKLDNGEIFLAAILVGVNVPNPITSEQWAKEEARR